MADHPGPWTVAATGGNGATRVVDAHGAPVLGSEDPHHDVLFEDDYAEALTLAATVAISGEDDDE